MFSKYTWKAPGSGRGFSSVDGSGMGIAGSTFFAAALSNENWYPSTYPDCAMPVAEFNYISAVYDAGHVKIYVNGIVEAEKTVSHNGTPYYPFLQYVFAETIIVADRFHRTFDGFIDELRIHKQKQPMFAMRVIRVRTKR